MATSGWVVDQSVVDQVASVTENNTESARQIYIKALRVSLRLITLRNSAPLN